MNRIEGCSCVICNYYKLKQPPDSSLINNPLTDEIDPGTIKHQLSNAIGTSIPYKPSYFLLESDKVVYCDVDETLVIWSGTSYSPHEKHIEMIKKFHERGQKVIIWSAGGYKWADRIVKELKLEPYISAVLSKPSWWMDDLTSAEVLLPANRIYIKPVDTDK